MNNIPRKISKWILAISLVFLFVTEILSPAWHYVMPEDSNILYDAEQWTQPFDFSGTADYVIKESGILVGWGDNSYGSIRDPGKFIGQIPGISFLCAFRPWPYFPAIMMPNMESVSADFIVALAVDKNGTLWGWGANTYGRLGNQDMGQRTPARIMEDVKMVSTGFTSCLALKKDGTVWAWGDEGSGYMEPHELMGGAKYVAIFNSQGCAIMENGDLYTWTCGWPLEPDMQLIPSKSPLKIAENAVQTANLRDEEGLLILKEDHSLWVWDRNNINGEIKKVMDGVRYCSQGVILTDEGKVVIWNVWSEQGSQLLTPENLPEDFFHVVSEDAIYAELGYSSVYILDKRGRLLQMGYEHSEDGAITVNKTRLLYQQVKRPY